MTLLTLPLKVNLDHVQFTDEQFYQLCLSNPELTIERDAEGMLIVMSPVGGDRSPDVAWVELSRWQALTPEERQKFPPIAPDFAIELRSRSDTLQTLQDKMLEYLQSGVRLGWLFNPQNQQVEIYRQGQTKEVRSLPTQLSGEDVLPGFVLNVPLFTD